MTDLELNTAILSIKTQMLSCNNPYLKRMSIGAKVTTDRQREVLRAVDIYLYIMDYYASIPEAVRDDESPITEDDVLTIIAESTKLLDTFQSGYYAS